MLREALTTLYGGVPPKLELAGRTDTGVNALGQVASLPPPPHPMGEEEMMVVLNRSLPEDLRVVGIGRVREDFHARFSALSRTYEYVIWTDPAQPVEWAWRSFYLPRAKLDLGAMEEVAAEFLSLEEFSHLASQVPEGEGRVRLYQFQVERRPARVVFTVRANRFLYRMVRHMVGLVIKVGLRRLKVAEARAIIGRRSRQVSPYLAPPVGLTLVEVAYPRELEEVER